MSYDTIVQSIINNEQDVTLAIINTQLTKKINQFRIKLTHVWKKKKKKKKKIYTYTYT